MNHITHAELRDVFGTSLHVTLKAGCRIVLIKNDQAAAPAAEQKNDIGAR